MPTSSKCNLAECFLKHLQHKLKRKKRSCICTDINIKVVKEYKNSEDKNPSCIFSLEQKIRVQEKSLLTGRRSKPNGRVVLIFYFPFFSSRKKKHLCKNISIQAGVRDDSIVQMFCLGCLVTSFSYRFFFKIYQQELQ